MVDSNRLDIVLIIEEADLLEHFPGMLDAVHIIYEDVYMNLLDHYNMSLQRGRAKLLIRHPYIQLASAEKARMVILN